MGIGYRPEIDGLRALAVIPVVMFHLGYGCTGGFVGVDMFFVISGFLITGIILRGLETRTFSLAEFWERRIRRIFPALFVMLATTLAIGYWLLLPSELQELGQSSVAQSLLIANIYYCLETGYFDGPAELKPLLHTWSLAVEEQFYIFLPLFLCLVKNLSRWRIFSILTAVAIASLVASIFGVMFNSEATFFLLPTRAWELLIGCMLAVFPLKLKSAPLRDGVISAIGLLAILLPIFLYDSETTFPGLAAVPPVFGTAAIIFSTSCTPKGWLGRLLSSKPFVFLGLISYSLYLWHWPTIVYTNVYFGWFLWKQAVFALVISFALAILSRRYIETPCRQTAFLAPRRKLLCTTLAVIGLSLITSTALVTTDGLPSRFPNFNRVFQDDLAWTGESNIVTAPEQIKVEDLPILGVAKNSGANNERLDFLLWGDSHAAVLCELMSEIAEGFELSGKAICSNAQVPIFKVCTPERGFPKWEINFRRKVRDILSTTRPRNLILACRWSLYTDGYSKVERDFPSRNYLHTRSPLDPALLEDNLPVLIAGLKELREFCENAGVNLWVIKEVPEAGESQPARTALLVAIGRRDRLPEVKTTFGDHRKRQQNVKNLFDAALTPSTRVIDPAPLFFRKDRLDVFVNGRSLYRDSDHLTRCGAEKLRGLFGELMREINNEMISHE